MHRAGVTEDVRGASSVRQRAQSAGRWPAFSDVGEVLTHRVPDMEDSYGVVLDREQHPMSVVESLPEDSL